MGLATGVKRPLLILCKRMNNPIHSRFGYSTVAHKRHSIYEFRETGVLFSSHFTNVYCGLGILSRRYSVGVSTSDGVTSEQQTSAIKQLTEKTIAPIRDIVSALLHSNWDIEAAQKVLRKRAAKNASSTAAQGLLALAQNERKAAVIELNCETDSVARNEIFQYLALSLARLALLAEGPQQAFGAVPVGPDSLEEMKMEFDHPKLNGEKTVQYAITEVAAMMGENIEFRRGFAMATPSSGVISTYLHTSPRPGLGRIAGLLTLEVEDKNASVEALHQVGSELAMHVVAAKPLFLRKELVSYRAIKSELEIAESQAKSTGKSQVVVAKMVEARLKKYFEEAVLMEQKFVVNDALTVKTLLDNLSKEVGSPVNIGFFLRMEVGEGLQRLEAATGPETFAETA